MASKIFVLIATLTVATCSPLPQTVCESQAFPNLLTRLFPRLPFNFPGRGIFNPSTTVCESSNPQLLTPSTTVCESNSIPNMFSLPNMPSTTVCESSQTPFNPMLPINPPATTVCESSQSLPSMYPGGFGFPNLGGLGMPNLLMNGMGMPMSGLGMPNMLMNGLGMPGMPGLSGFPNLGLSGLGSMGLPMPIVATLLNCLGIM